MEVEFRPAAEDYRGFYRYNAFRRNIGMRIALVGLFSVLIGLDSRHSSWAFHILPALVFGAVLLIIAMVVPYIITIIKNRKGMKRLEATDFRWRIELTGDGFLVQTVTESEPEKEKKFWRWQAIKFAGGSSKYVFIVMIPGGCYVIPKSAFQSTEEANHFLFILEAGMETVWGSKSTRAKKLYLWGLLGLIPNVGVIAGLILLIKGIFQFKDWILIVIGVSDILFTIVFWWVMTTVIFNGSIFKTQEIQMARSELNAIFRYVEFYKIQHGVYPDSLQQMPLTRDNIWIGDPVQSQGTKQKTVNFFYQKVGEKYWLFSVGPDGKPFTRDDIYPTMNPADSGKFGLLKGRYME